MLTNASPTERRAFAIQRALRDDVGAKTFRGEKSNWTLVRHASSPTIWRVVRDGVMLTTAENLSEACYLIAERDNLRTEAR